MPSLSRTLIYDYEQNPDSGNNVVALAAKAGYSTWWISNQGKLGEHDTRISVIASDADHTVFLKKGTLLPVKRMTCCCYRKQNVRWQIHPLRR